MCRSVFGWLDFTAGVCPPLGGLGQFLGFAHGPVVVNFSMEAAAEEVVAWANLHAAEAEDALVLVVVEFCGGDPGCFAATAAAFARVGLPAPNCSLTTNMTLGDAMQLGSLAGGGHALALMACPSAPVNTYNDRLSCTGFINITEGEVCRVGRIPCARLFLSFFLRCRVLL